MQQDFFLSLDFGLEKHSVGIALKITTEKIVYEHDYAKHEGISLDQLPTPGDGSFIPVYELENEYLSEIENKTVEAAIHFSKVPLEPGIWTIHMAIYVKPKGLFGRLYMILIKPFRVWVVYPAIMKAARKRWNEYLKNI